MKAPRTKPRQYTIRNVPPEVDRALRKQARTEGKSLNEVVLEAFRRAISDPSTPKYNDLDGIIGTWVEDPEFDKILEEQRRIDPELWR